MFLASLELSAGIELAQCCSDLRTADIDGVLRHVVRGLLGYRLLVVIHGLFVGPPRECRAARDSVKEGDVLHGAGLVLGVHPDAMPAGQSNGPMIGVPHFAPDVHGGVALHGPPVPGPR